MSRQLLGNYPCIYYVQVIGPLYLEQKRIFFYKFWRTVELDLLKQDSIDSNKLWKAAGKTRSETILQGSNHPDYYTVKDFVMNMC